MQNYFRKIGSLERNPVLDLCRAIAILMVVFAHFLINFQDKVMELIYTQGQIGVDFFFVLSGYLVGREPLRHFLAKRRQDFRSFYIKRFFKIIPSFWFVLIMSYLLYNVLFPFPLKRYEDWELLYYFAFIQNYTGSNVFFYAWSLCVEEHFYLLLPLSLFLLTLFADGNREKLRSFLIITIILGYVFRLIGFLIGFETYAATHNRIDALALGVLFAFQDLTKSKFINHEQSMNRKQKLRIVTGISLIAIALIIGSYSIWYENANNFFYQVLYRGMVPLGTYLILSQTLYIKIRIPIWIKYASYFSYNWYLWHSIIVFYFIYYSNNNIYAIFPYLIFTFLVSVLVTFFVEEPFMRMRNKILSKNKR